MEIVPFTVSVRSTLLGNIEENRLRRKRSVNEPLQNFSERITENQTTKLGKEHYNIEF